MKKMNYLHSVVVHLRFKIVIFILITLIMTFAWKTAGYTYLKYLEVCSKALRSCVKSDLQAAAERRSESTLKFANWENGKQGEIKMANSIFTNMKKETAQQK